MTDPDRLARLEAMMAIQQLAVKYAIAIDSRDLDLMARQWTADAWMGRAYGAGREAVKNYFRPKLEGFYRSIHMVVGHSLDLLDEDHATGQVYCRAEHEYLSQWIVQAIAYEDTYRRVDGEWGFYKRRHRHWYTTPFEIAPKPPDFQRSPLRRSALPELPHDWESWSPFWSAVDRSALASVTEAPEAPA
jgi:hypothetical protein